MEKLYLERIRDANRAIEIIQSSARIPLMKKLRGGKGIFVEEEDRMKLDESEARLGEWKAERLRQFNLLEESARLRPMAGT